MLGSQEGVRVFDALYLHMTGETTDETDMDIVRIADVAIAGSGLEIGRSSCVHGWYRGCGVCGYMLCLCMS